MKEILCIDDDELDHYLSENAIHSVSEDIIVHKAYDGLQALSCLREDKICPEIILLDVNMPRMNGHEFLKEFARTHDGRIPIIIMLTSSDQKTDIDLSMQYTFVKDFLVKPLTEEHVKKIQDIMESLAAGE
ncbi:MAG: response regulator [Rhodospirillales bacterium]|nr:response regulator [Alphaproteobacteria bacterium]MCB9977492.1 response regulator [Rhodospirillales bacterium]